MSRFIHFTSIFILLGMMFFVSPAIAITPTVTPSSIRDSVKQRVTEELSQIKQAVAKKGFVGSITSKTDGTFTLTNLNNQTRNLTLTTDAAIKLLAGKDGTVADIKIGDMVIAMGDVDSNNQMTAKRIVAIAKIDPENRRAVYGTVSKVSSSSLTVDTIKGETLVVRLTSATKYTGNTKAADVKTGAKVVILLSSTSNTHTALHLHLVPAN